MLHSITLECGQNIFSVDAYCSQVIAVISDQGWFFLRLLLNFCERNTCKLTGIDIDRFGAFLTTHSHSKPTGTELLIGTMPVTDPSGHSRDTATAVSGATAPALTSEVS